MTDMENKAKVFGDGDVTIVVNRTTGAARVYVGTEQIGFLQGLKLNLDFSEAVPKLEFAFPQSHEQSVALKIEEQVRVVKQGAPWAKVVR